MTNCQREGKMRSHSLELRQRGRGTIKESTESQSIPNDKENNFER